MLDLLARYGNALAALISALFGGGIVAAYRTWMNQTREDEDQMHTQAMELSGRLEDRLAAVEGRLDAAEEELRQTQKQLTQSQIRREELSAAIDALVDRIDRLISRLAKHEQISDRERSQLTSVPYVEPNSKAKNDPAP